MELENDDIRTVLTQGEADPNQPSIRFCDVHYAAQEQALEAYGEPTEVAFMNTFHIIASLATRTLGTNTVVHFGCPICALQQFDYINNLIPIVLGVRTN